MVLRRVSPQFPVLGSPIGTEMSGLMHADASEDGVYEIKASDIGRVVLGFDVDVSGVAKNIEVKQSYEPAFSREAISALKEWKFRPAIS